MRPMALSITEARQLALRVAKQLAGRGRAGEAVAVLCAWAVAGTSDQEGQGLLAEALQLDPRSALSKMAFERMEGIAGDHGALNDAVQLYSEAELGRLDRELRPAFRKAQLGFNNDLKYKSLVYHVQTEDSGLDKPHVLTHLFADGGRVIKSFKRTYATEVGRADVAQFVRDLMKGQHMEMVLALREGRFDGIIEGRERGGMEVLETSPNVEVSRVGNKKPDEAKAQTATPPPVKVVVQPAKPKGKVHYFLHVMRSLTGGPERYEPDEDDAIIGSQGSVALPGERFCHPTEAVLHWVEGRLLLEDLDGGNGVFLRIRSPVEIGIGDEFIIGDQLLRIENPPTPDHTPGPGPTYCYSSPVWPSPFRVAQILEGGSEGTSILARRTSLYIGSGYNDMIIKGDPLVGEHHCLLDEQAGSIILYDLSSKTGVFVRVQGQQELRNGDELLIGRTRLLVDFSPTLGRAS